MPRKKRPPHGGLGAPIARVALWLDEIGGVDTEWRLYEMRRRFGQGATESLLYWWCRPNTRKDQRIVWVRRGVYRLTDKHRELARAWLRTNDADRFRRREIARIEKKARADMKAIESSAGPSVWRTVRKHFDERRRMRKTQTGRVILALMSHGPMKKADLDPYAGPNGWSFSRRDKALKDGRIVFDRLTGLHDLPGRTVKPNMAKNRNELLLLTLAAAGPQSMADLAQMMGIKRRVMKDAALKRCRKRGEVERTGPERYAITEVGMERVREIVARKIGGERDG